MACIPLLADARQAIVGAAHRVAPAVDRPCRCRRRRCHAARHHRRLRPRRRDWSARCWSRTRVPYVAVDSDADRVAAQRRLAAAGLLWRRHAARVSAPLRARDGAGAGRHHGRSRRRTRRWRAARALRADLLIVARARDARHAARLYALGATDAVPETIEASLQLSEAVLVDLGVPMGPVIASIHERRAEMQAEIKAMAPHAEVRPLGRRRLRDMLPRAG